MQLQLSQDDVRPLVQAVLTEAIRNFESQKSTTADKLAYNEPEAARMLSLKPHQLRDERLRGRIGFSSIVGRQVRYTQADLMAYLARERTEASA